MTNSTYERTNGGGFRPVGAGAAQSTHGREICWFARAGTGLELLDEQQTIPGSAGRGAASVKRVSGGQGPRKLCRPSLWATGVACRLGCGVLVALQTGLRSGSARPRLGLGRVFH